jgi:hypothetical protein
MTRRMLIGAAMAASLSAGAAFAHHGWGDYDAAKMFTIEAPIETAKPGNPHVVVTVKHDGKTWLAVLAPASRMTTRGLPPETLKPGLSVKIEGYPKRGGEPEMRAERITVAGKTVELR